MEPNSLSHHKITQGDFETLRFTTGTGLSTIEVIPALGGAINRLQLQRTNKQGSDQSLEDLISPISAKEYINGNPYYKGVLLFPFVNRLDNGEYSYNGKNYHFPINEPALSNSLHGFLFNRPATIKTSYPEQNETLVSIQFSYSGDMPAYPFAMDINVEYRLHDTDGLKVTFNITNRHHNTAPLAVGWHPYFVLRGNLANWQMQLPTVRHISVDKRLLPTGHKYHYEHFAKLKAIGDTQLDHCFQLDRNRVTENNRSSSYLWSEEHQYGLDIWQQTEANAFDYLQVCIPPSRDCIAIEPVSANINAFNNGEGLTHLEPNEIFSQECGVRLISTKPSK